VSGSRASAWMTLARRFQTCSHKRHDKFADPASSDERSPPARHARTPLHEAVRRPEVIWILKTRAGRLAF
jgi:hypothetical protein